MSTSRTGATTRHQSRLARRLVGSPLRSADDRLGFAGIGRKALGKVFPDHWSFMLGEIALYCFMVLVGTGIFLTMFFDPSSSETTYIGSDPFLHGQEVSSAFSSTVSLSWDVQGGLLMRQVHHWAANIFIAAIVLHLCRIFFTGMFRKPRELNWTIGLTLLVFAIFNSFAGYSLPDDLLSGTGLHIFYSVFEAVPVIGPWFTYLVFGAAFPGPHIIPRLYALHIFVVPAILALLIGAHMVVLIRQKHSHFAGPGRSDANVVGSRMWPSYALRSLSLLCAVAAVCFFMGGFAQINPIWTWGEFKSYSIISPSVADWYIAWIEGALRLMPPLEIHFWGMTVPNQFWPSVLLPGLVFGLLYAWPWIDRRLTGDRGAHHVAAAPTSSPRRFTVGVVVITFLSVLLVASGEEAIVMWTGVPIGTVRVTLRVLALALPVVTGFIAWRVARGRLPAQGRVEEEKEEASVRPLHEQPIWLKARAREAQLDEDGTSETIDGASHDGADRVEAERVAEP
ncbi:MAG TPA: ubiquinol-cytochrome c reductase cytochrome b subunit [Marmoricola sp.]|nr:ubiquinol-cytochrome c reductase cytochrome b subunit [Marmoricola sp.]